MNFEILKDILEKQARAEGLEKYTGDSFRDLTRIAKIFIAAQ